MPLECSVLYKLAFLVVRLTSSMHIFACLGVLVFMPFTQLKQPLRRIPKLPEDLVRLLGPKRLRVFCL